MKTLILTIGLPQSGKSTWAQKQGHPIVNRDSIRLAFHGHAYIQESEPVISVFEEYMVKSLFIAGHDTVIVDATHLRPEYIERWQKSKLWEVQFEYFTGVPVEECIRRARENGREELIPVIKRMSEHVIERMSERMPEYIERWQKSKLWEVTK